MVSAIGGNRPLNDEKTPPLRANAIKHRGSGGQNHLEYLAQNLLTRLLNRDAMSDGARVSPSF